MTLRDWTIPSTQKKVKRESKKKEEKIIFLTTLRIYNTKTS